MKNKNKNVVTEQGLVSKKAFFYQRIVAYMLDMFIITLIVSLISQPFMDLKSIEKLEKQSSEIMEKYQKQKINTKTYIYQSIDVNYQLAKSNGIFSLVSMAIMILYFIVYQFYNKGQTIGKKIMNIEIMKYDRTSLTINDIIYRSLIVNSIILNMFTFALMVFTSRDIYGYGTIFLDCIQNIILITIIIMIIFRKDGRGLHDIIANTIVVKKDILKEEECKA